VLTKKAFAHLALADPRLAPYGAAGVEVLQALGLFETLQPRFVTAANSTQAYQFVASGNAELGFVALSQVYKGGRIAEGSGWIVPQALYQPIRQDAVLLSRGKGKPAVEAFLQYLRGDKAREIIQSYGYTL
jgi:molybdate transport system substrate-binding protein